MHEIHLPAVLTVIKTSLSAKQFFPFLLFNKKLLILETKSNTSLGQFISTWNFSKIYQDLHIHVKFLAPGTVPTLYLVPIFASLG